MENVRAGQSRVLVLRGEAGVGKTALLEYLQGRASGCRIARAAGVESEMELPFAGLHQLCAPMLHRLGRLPGPQGDALGAAFGLREGDAPDRFLVGLAVLSLLSDVAEEYPLICVVDDAQWLDRASAQALAFVTRRLVAESVAVVFAVRESGDEQDLTGLPELQVRGLADPDARALLESVITGPLDERVRDRIVAETRGNPLALLELPRGLTPAELAGGFGLPDAPALSGRIEESFRRRLDAASADTRLLLLVAAAEPVGDPVLLWRAAERLGIGAEAAAPAAEAGLVEFGGRVRFRHPLVRSAVYRSAPRSAQSVHRALAEATDPDLDPIAGPGTAPRRHRGSTRTSPPSSSARPAAPRPAAAWPRPPRSSSAPPAHARADAPGSAYAGRRAEQAPGRRTRHGAGPARHGPGRTARQAPASACGVASRPDHVRREPGPRRSPVAARGRQTA